ncbi:FHA domain-containing protein [Salinicola sp. CPA57]|uniref:SctD/MshK family protein n=1 Tax=Salinicola sp. CPA57 TaxID=1949080 RepID=UPI000DA18864|nr:FHA domain-containing protein [Salinicola sp. CPA57]
MESVTSSLASAREIVTTLTVTAGLHRGAAVDLTDTVCRIGSQDTADVLLSDAGIAPEHLVLRFHGRQMAVEAVGGDIVINGRTVTQGTGLRSELPAELCCGGVTLTLSRPEAPAIMPTLPRLPPLSPRWRTSLNRGATMLALVATLGVLAVYEFIDVNQAGANIGGYPLRAKLDPQVLEGVSQMVADARPGQAEALRQHLADAGLASLSVTDHGAYLSVSGDYAANQVDAWHQTQRWFDQHFGSHQVLLNTARPRVAPARPDLKLQAVWLGTNPYVIDNRGKRLYPGAALASGWVISAIQPEQVLLRRGDDQFALTL